MKEIHVFDIDGTVLPSVFPNMQESDKSIDQIIKDVLECSNSVGLFPEFITYYSQNCANGSKNIFLTGRQESAFGDLTHMQLSPLKETSPFHIIFYPEENFYTSRDYFSWKTQEIRNLFLEHLSCNHHDQVKFIIYDDLTNHFGAIKEISKSLKVDLSLRSIKNSRDWTL